MDILTYCSNGSDILVAAFRKFYSFKNNYYIFVTCPKNDKTKPGILDRYTRVLDPKYPTIFPMGEYHRVTQARLPGGSFSHALTLRNEFVSIGAKNLLVAINEGGHGVRNPEPFARIDLIDIAQGLYVAEAPFQRCVLFQEGPGYTTQLNHWKGVDHWLNDKDFWAGMKKFVRWYCPEVYIGPEEFLSWDLKKQDSWLFGSLIRAKHTKSPASKVLSQIYVPLISMYWMSKKGYRNTWVSLQMMKRLFWAQMSRIDNRHWPAVAIAWNEHPSNRFEEEVKILAESIARRLNF